MFWNPWHGCHKCSAGCDRCYMYALDKARQVPEKSSVVTRTQNFDMPLKKNKKGEYKIKSGTYLMVNMTSDTFVEEADEWREEFWDIIRRRSDVKFYILTKRPERMLYHLPDDWGDGWDHVSLNVTVENQEMFEKRWPYFKVIPAKHKGFNCAPLISDIDLMPALLSHQIESVEVGGENYENPRPCNELWVRHIAAQCKMMHVNFVWYETGTYLIRGKQVYSFPNKKEQSRAAYDAGISYVWEPLKWTLHSPEDGHVLRANELMIPMYNKYSCSHCSRIYDCAGCSKCGKCGKVELVSRDDIVMQAQSRILI